MSLYETVKNNVDKFYDYEKFLEYCNSGSTILDSNLYTELLGMLKSENDDDITLSMEIMANCNYNKSIVYLLKLFQEHSNRMSTNKHRNNVNFKSLCDYLDIRVRDRLTLETMVKTLEEKNLLTLSNINQLIPGIDNAR